MILHRTNPPLPFLPRYDPPKQGQYNAETMARFVRNYRAIARGFYDAVRTERLRVTIWLCPKCGSENTVKRMDESDQPNNRCRHCELGSTYNEVLMGVIYKEPPCRAKTEPAVVRTRHHQSLATIAKNRILKNRILSIVTKYECINHHTLTSIADKHEISVERLRRIVKGKCLELGLEKRAARVLTTANLIRYLKTAERDNH